MTQDEIVARNVLKVRLFIDAWEALLPVCGMFELTEDGKIREWREYYDNEQWSKNSGPSLLLA